MSPRRPEVSAAGSAQPARAACSRADPRAHLRGSVLYMAALSLVRATRRHEQIQRELRTLQAETYRFLLDVIANPENKELLEQLRPALAAKRPQK